MHHNISTLIFDMYGVILKERTGNFIVKRKPPAVLVVPKGFSFA